jgi:hypothetical protein
MPMRSDKEDYYRERYRSVVNTAIRYARVPVEVKDGK